MSFLRVSKSADGLTAKLSTTIGVSLVDLMEKVDEREFFHYLYTLYFVDHMCPICGDSISLRNVVSEESYKLGAKGADGAGIGCFRCCLVILKCKDECWRSSQFSRLGMSNAESWRDRLSSQPLQVHVDTNFWAFTINPLYRLGPGTLLSLGQKLVTEDSPNIYDFVADFIHSMNRGFGSLRHSNYAFMHSNSGTWAILPRFTALPTALPTIESLHNVKIPDSIIRAEGLKLEEATSILYTIEMYRQQGNYSNADRSIAKLLEAVARKAGLILPELTEDIKAKIDGVLLKFGDPNKIRARKRVRRRAGG